MSKAFFDELHIATLMAAPSVIVQSRRWSYGRVKRAAVRRLFFLGRRPAVDYVDYIERKIAIPQKTESAESVPGY